MKTTKIQSATPTTSAVYQTVICNRIFVIFKRADDKNWSVYENSKNLKISEFDKMEWVDIAFRMPTKKITIETIKYCHS